MAMTFKIHRMFWKCQKSQDPTLGKILQKPRNEGESDTHLHLNYDMGNLQSWEDNEPFLTES